MFRLGFIIALAVAASLASGRLLTKRDVSLDIAPRVIGPDVVPDGDPSSVHHESHFRYQVSLQKGCGHGCGATIISPRLVITAAHCTIGTPPSHMSVRVGTLELGTGGQVADVFTYYNHPLYDRPALIYDLAVLVLQTPLDLSGLTRAELPSLGESFIGEYAEVSGWAGLPGEPQQFLRHTNVSVLDHGQCRHSPSRICVEPITAYDGTCFGDSGGPLVVRRNDRVVLIGAVSGGYKCATPGVPSWFANIAYMREWVDSVITEAESMVIPFIDRNINKFKKHNC